MRTIFSLLLSVMVSGAFAQNKNVTGGDQPAGVYQKSCGGISTGGRRSCGTVYFIDGVQPRQLPIPQAAVPITSHMQVPGTYGLSKEEVSHMPCTNVRDIASIFPGVYQQRRGDDLRIYGSR